MIAFKKTFIIKVTVFILFLVVGYFLQIKVLFAANVASTNLSPEYNKQINNQVNKRTDNQTDKPADKQESNLASEKESKKESKQGNNLEAELVLLTKNLRCVVCQNQNLYDSEALISKKIKQEIHAMLQNNIAKDEIIDSLMMRYGEVISYEPKKNIINIWLWLLPALFVLLGIVLVFKEVTKD